MSVSYNLKISVSSREPTGLSTVSIIQCFLANGWSLYSEDDKIIYTTVGDDDDFDFLAESIGTDEYFEIVNQKERKKENIAFALFYLEECIRYRVDIILTPSHDIIISPDDMTKKILLPAFNILDVNWYLGKILPSFNNDNILVEGITFTQM